MFAKASPGTADHRRRSPRPLRGRIGSASRDGSRLPPEGPFGVDDDLAGAPPERVIALDEVREEQLLLPDVDAGEVRIPLEDAVLVVDEVRELHGLGFRRSARQVLAVDALALGVVAIARTGDVGQTRHKMRNFITE